MSRKKKAPQIDAGLFCLMMPDAAGENQKSQVPPIDISISKSRKVVQSRAKPRSGAQHP